MDKYSNSYVLKRFEKNFNDKSAKLYSQAKEKIRQHYSPIRNKELKKFKTKYN